MDAYLDTGALVPLYVSEVFSEAITRFLERRGEAVPYNAFHRLELENALVLKVFRRELAEGLRMAALEKISMHLQAGKLIQRPVSWVAALDAAREFANRVTVQTGCRTLDLIHVAIARQWGCSVFVSADERQLAAADAAGLATEDLRTMARRTGNYPSTPGAVKERRTPYCAARPPRPDNRKPLPRIPHV